AQVCVYVLHMTFPKRARETAHHHILPTHSLAGGVDRHGKGFMGKNTVFMGDSVRTRSSSTQTYIPIRPHTHTHTHIHTHIHIHKHTHIHTHTHTHTNTHLGLHTLH